MHTHGAELYINFCISVLTGINFKQKEKNRSKKKKKNHMHTTQPADELTKKANKQQFFVTSDALCILKHVLIVNSPQAKQDLM